VVDFFASVERVTTLQAVLNSGTSVRIFSLLGKLFKLRWRCRCLSESGTRPRNRGSSLAAVSSCPIARARRSAALNWSAVPASIMRPNTSAPGGLGQESRPSAQRYSISIVRPSIQPNSRSRCHKTATRWACVAVCSRLKRTVGSLDRCCACAANGHDITAAPPSAAMNKASHARSGRTAGSRMQPARIRL
jgi:hypothetical protein